MLANLEENLMPSYHPVTRITRLTGCAALLSLASSSVFASGFALIEQSVSSMGTAYAGAGSATVDPSTIYFNPASMSGMEGQQISAGLHIVLPSTEFSGTGTFTNTGSPLDGTPFQVAGDGNGGDAGETGYLPHLGYVGHIDDKLTAGITINVPFGLKTEYDSGWAGRYSAIESEIKSFNLNPSLSYQVNEMTSIGIGVSAMYAELRLKNAIDYGLLVLGSPGTLATDGTAQLDVDDWGYGFNVGVLFEPSDSTKIGVAYRSEVDVDLSGDVSITAVGPIPASSQSAQASTDLPSSATLSLTHDLDDQWTVMGDVTWTSWSNQDALVANLANGSANIIPLQWDDTVRVAVGTSYNYSDRLTLRTGVAYDETPVPSDSFRIASLPDEDRIWLAFGAGYKYSDKLTFDVGYAHLFIDDTGIDSDDAANTGIPGSPFHHLSGEYDASVDILSAQANWKF
jgi:long-chain fatty acid transport protein